MKRLHKPLSFYLLLVVGFIVLIIAVLLSILWYQNQNISHPLPFTDSDNISVSENAESTQSEQTIHIVVRANLQPSLDSIINKFNKYYPHITTHVSYVAADELSEYVRSHSPVHVVISDSDAVEDLYHQSNRSNYTEETQVDEIPFDFASLKTQAANAEQTKPIKIQGYILDSDSHVTSPVADNEPVAGNNSATNLFKRFFCWPAVCKNGYNHPSLMAHPSLKV